MSSSLSRVVEEGSGRLGPELSEQAWRDAMKRAVRDPAQLCRLLRLPDSLVVAAERAAQLFPLFAPRAYIGRMRPGDPHDPLLRQVLPLDAEQSAVPGYSRDPVGDLPASLRPGVIQKYAGRALLITTGACAVHCRYCFRRHFPYGQVPKSAAAWDQALTVIAQDRSIDEVLLSGGDPLTLVDDLVAQLVDRLAAIPHLRRLRVHTRLPIMIPQRITARLLDSLAGSRLQPILVIHANHPAELDQPVAAAVRRCTDAGMMVLNQAVLLRGVNDQVETLARLSERLIELRVVPYYLHQLDRVMGAAHFDVPEQEGRLLMEQLRVRLPGYAVPRYVREVAGEPYKVPLF